MANRKKEVYKPKPMTEEEKEILFRDCSRNTISSQQMIFRRHLKICFPEPFKICLKQKWTIILDTIVMKDLVSLITVMEQSLKLFVVNTVNSK